MVSFEQFIESYAPYFGDITEDAKRVFYEDCSALSKKHCLKWLSLLHQLEYVLVSPMKSDSKDELRSVLESIRAEDFSGLEVLYFIALNQDVQAGAD